MRGSILICGLSTRAAAESAALAGFRVTAIDAFADLDQHPSVRALSLDRGIAAPGPPRGTRLAATAMAGAARSIDCDAVAYLSPFENHPRAVSSLAAGRSLWGNTPAVLRAVRDPFRLAAAVRRYGLAVPRLWNDSNDPNDPNDSWLAKPFRSGGGRRIRLWRGGSVPRTHYLQERIEGTPGSLVFAAAGGTCVPLGFSRQLVGDAGFGARDYRYCGSIVAPLDDAQFAAGAALFGRAVALARCVAAEFGLAGLGGLDFMARDGVPYLLEVNPRWSSSMEIAERAFGTVLFAAHADACVSSVLPAFDCARALSQTAAYGKAIVYARRDGSVGDTSAWLDDPDIRDVPRSGHRVRTGQPICTVFATAPDSLSCYRALADRAGRIYRELGQESGVRVATVTG